MTKDLNEESVRILARIFVGVVDRGRMSGMSDLEIGAALGIALANIGGSAENIRNITAFACSQFPNENSNVRPFPIKSKEK